MALFGNDPEAVRAALTGQAVSDDETRETMRSVLKDHSYLLDPHGAVSFRALNDQLKPGEHGIFLHTAHPAKFSEVIRDTLGIEPPIPPQLAEIMHRPINPRSIAPESLALEEFLRELAEK
jgi:threonine synthase